MTSEQPTDGVLSALVEWANKRDSVRAMVLTSTKAVPNAPVDALSDYDVIVIVQAIHPFVADRCWLNDFGDVLVAYWDPIHADPTFGIEKISVVTQYADGLKIDFNLWPLPLFQQVVAAPVLSNELDAGYRVLLDKDHLTESMQLPTYTGYIHKRPTKVVYDTLINDFLSDAPYVAKCLWRDELLPAKWALDTDMKGLYLRQVLEWRIAMDHSWSISTGALGKGLKKRLPSDIWECLEETYVGAGLSDNWEALANTMALFRRVAMEVGADLGYIYPDHLHQRVNAYIQQIKHMDRP